MRGRQGKRCALIGASALVALLLAVPLVRAAETPEEYTREVEPICKANVLANKRIFKGAKGEVKAGELKKASKHFFRAAEAFSKTIRELAAVSQPPGYETKLGKWLDILGDEKAIIKKIGQALAAEQRNKAESYSVELNRNSNKANNTVISFGFDYCRIDSSRFG